MPKRLNTIAEKSEALKQVSTNGLALQYCSEKLRSDVEVVSKAIEENGWALQYTTPELKDDEKIVQLCINQITFRNAIRLASRRLQISQEFKKAGIQSFKEEARTTGSFPDDKGFTKARVQLEGMVHRTSEWNNRQILEDELSELIQDGQRFWKFSAYDGEDSSHTQLKSVWFDRVCEIPAEWSRRLVALRNIDSTYYLERKTGEGSLNALVSDLMEVACKSFSFERWESESSDTPNSSLFEKSGIEEIIATIESYCSENERSQSDLSEFVQFCVSPIVPDCDFNFGFGDSLPESLDIAVEGWLNHFWDLVYFPCDGDEEELEMTTGIILKNLIYEILDKSLSYDFRSIKDTEFEVNYDYPIDNIEPAILSSFLTEFLLSKFSFETSQSQEPESISLLGFLLRSWRKNGRLHERILARFRSRNEDEASSLIPTNFYPDTFESAEGDLEGYLKYYFYSYMENNLNLSLWRDFPAVTLWLRGTQMHLQFYYYKVPEEWLDNKTFIRENLMLYRESCKGLEGKAEEFTSEANEILKLASKRLQKDPELQNLCIIDA